MTKREIEVFDDPAAFRRAVAGKKEQRASPSTGSAVPRGPKGEGDHIKALERLALHGVSMRFDAGVGFYAWNASTGWKGQSRDSYAEAIALAEKELAL